MCDFFWKRMENNDQGDLADIVRASGGRSSSGPLTSSSDFPSAGVDNWQFPTEPMAFQPLMSTDDFGGGGDPFTNLRDPLLHELAGTAFFDGLDATAKIGSDGGGSGTGVGGGELLAQKILLGEEMKRPCNLFSRVLQISPGGAKTPPLTPRAIKPSPFITGGEMVKVEHGVQISSPRTPGIKRRKSQAKKVVCIPAPAAASSRPSGEVVPSDLWAWRKYGQKPIKGSPYPRGYYRCSSSKGCSARKQVERSRTDPNMLVITYTSEHNHPWPTQRNALAGSTRSQPSKNSTSASKSSPHTQRPPTTLKEEPKETTTMTSSSLPIVKEEVFGEMERSVIEASTADDHEFDQLFYNEPVMAEPNLQSDDFFADLAELEPDPMSLIFSRSGFIGDKSDEEERERNKGLDSFVNIFDWGGSSFGDQPKKDL